MRRVLDNDSGQLILIACVLIAVTLILITTYEYSALEAGEKSINRENSGSAYFYIDVINRYTSIYCNNAYWDFRNTENLTYFENDMKGFALLHGYSLGFIRNGTTTRVVFVDKDTEIQEELNLLDGRLCH